jgi:hypothetical protein
MASVRQQRQATGVIEMSVGEQNGIDLLFRGGGRTIQGFGFFAALEQAAIHEHARLFGLNVIRRPGDFTARGADNRDFHEVLINELAKWS